MKLIIIGSIFMGLCAAQALGSEHERKMAGYAMPDIASLAQGDVAKSNLKDSLKRVITDLVESGTEQFFGLSSRIDTLSHVIEKVRTIASDKLNAYLAKLSPEERAMIDVQLDPEATQFIAALETLQEALKALAKTIDPLKKRYHSALHDLREFMVVAKNNNQLISSYQDAARVVAQLFNLATPMEAPSFASPARMAKQVKDFAASLEGYRPFVSAAEFKSLNTGLKKLVDVLDNVRLAKQEDALRSALVDVARAIKGIDVAQTQTGQMSQENKATDLSQPSILVRFEQI